MIRLSLAVAAGSAVGGVLRFWLTWWVAARLPTPLPLGTILVNIIGSLGIGVLAAVSFGNPRALGGPLAQQMLMAGVLGGFTTFSAFSLQSLLLLQHGRWADAATNVVVSVISCLLAVWIGWAAGRLLIAS